MSTIPSRTRSIRKSATGTESTRETILSYEVDASQLTARSGNEFTSRLPVKPPTPTSTSSQLSRSASISRNGAASSSSGAMRPPPRPTITRLQKTSDSKPFTRSRTLTDSSGSAAPASYLQRKASISTSTPASRHSRTSSTSNVSSRPGGPGHTKAASTTTASVASRAAPPGNHDSREDTSSTQSVASGRARGLSALTASTVLKPPSQSFPNSIAAPQRSTFSTFQQHYSPAKNVAPKPATATFLVPPSPSKLPANVAISAETARLQAELLQLHLLHRDSLSVQQQWKASAHTKLEQRFNDVVARHKVLINKESKQQLQANALAFQAWDKARLPGWGLEEKIQALDQAMTGLWKASDASGKHAQLVQRFERWLRTAQAILDERNQRGSDPQQVRFIEGLEQPGWTDECTALHRKLSNWSEALDQLDAPLLPLDDGPSCDVVAAVQSGRALTRGMLEELNVMQRVVEEVVRREELWIADLCERDDEDGEDGGQPVGAVWRIF